MTAGVQAGVARADGADLYFERRGHGPPLLMITGGGGDCGYYSAAADILASDYTVITYDRRGNSRSRLHGAPVKIDMAGQSADAIAVLAACEFGSARIFGNSGGASIALDLAAHHPEIADVIVAHEPPVPGVLDDPGHWTATFDEVDRVLAAEGWLPAFLLFQTRIGLLPAGRPELQAAMLAPERVFPPGPRRELMRRVSGNWAYMMTYEVRSFVDYEPDLDLIAGHRVRIAAARGARTRDQTAILMSMRVAERLGAECAKFSGGHTSAVEIPATFARELRSLLARLDG